MNRTRRLFLSMLGLTAAGLAIIYATSAHNPLTGVDLGLPGMASAEHVHVTVATSVTKKKWLEAAAARFMAANAATKSGKPIDIEIKGVLSGDSMQQILAGELKPVVWSPGEESWTAQFAQRWSEKHARPASTAPCKPTIYTPSGLAIWRPMAEALGWPAKKVGWKTIMDLAADSKGWGRYGHPEWGKLKLGYTHPQYSSAGLLFVTSVVYGILGQTGALKAEQVYAPAVQQALAAMAQNTSKYGMVTTDLFDLMASRGPDYLHAISAFEEGTVRLNLERSADLRWPLVFLFPSEGTFWSDHPYCILDGIPWVSEEQAEGARQFLDFLLAREQQILASENLLRPLDAHVPLGSQLTAANGTDPSARPESEPAYEFPDASASAAIIDQFLATKRKATVMLVLDVSGSMAGEPIRAATDATASFLRRLDPRDRVGLMVFNDKVSVVSDVQSVATDGEALSQRVVQLVAGGGTNLNGAVCAAVAKMNEAHRVEQASGENRLYGIVLLSDGADTTGEMSETRMLQTCLPSSLEAEGTKVFAIAFGQDANRETLDRIARSSGGKMFESDSASIDQTYLKISAEQ